MKTEQPAAPETAPEIAVLSRWDGVHLWLDHLQPLSPAAASGQRCDLRFTAAHPRQVQILYGVALPCALTAPFHAARVEARPARAFPAAESDDTGWQLATHVALKPAAAHRVQFAFTHASPVIQIASGAILAATHGGHACGWEVVVRAASDGSVLICRPVNLSPRHLLRVPGEAICVADAAANIILYNTEPGLDRPWSVLGPAESITPLAAPEKDAPLILSLHPQPSGQTPLTEETLWQPAYTFPCSRIGMIESTGTSEDSLLQGGEILRPLTKP